MTILKEFKINYKPMMLDVNSLNIDYSYQRPKTSIIEKISQEFNALAFGRICVGLRKDGTYWIVDGQQRTAAAKLINKTSVPCDVFDSSGSKQEALIFQQINKNRKKVTPGEIFKAGLKSGNTFYVDINNIVEAHGFKFNFDRTSTNIKWPYLQAFSVLERIHKEGTLNKVFQIINKCWLEEDSALKESFLYAIHLFIVYSGTSLNEDHMIKAFSKTLPSAIDLAARKEIIATPFTGYMRYQAIMKQLVKIYNKRNRNKLS